MKKALLTLTLLFFSTAIILADSPKDKVEEYASTKNYVKAANYIPEAVQRNFEDFDFLVLSGDIYKALKRLDSALIMYRKADDVESDEPEVLRKIAAVLTEQGKYNQALEAVREAIDEDKKDVKNYLALGKVYIEADSLKQAELYITKAREMDKDRPEAYIALGDLYFAQRVYELAKNNYEKALSMDEDNVEARTKLAISYYWLANREFDYDEDLAQEYFKKSLKEWNTITKQDSMNAKAFFEQGKIFFFSKRWQDAARSLYRYVQLRPNGLLGRWYLAQSLYEVAACDSAEKHLRICAEKIDSVSTKARLLLARCYFDAKKYDKSMEAFNKIKAEKPLNKEDLERYGMAAFKQRDTLTALKNYEKVIEMNPERCGLMYKTGIMYYRLKKYDKSIDVFLKRVKHCEDEQSSNSYFFIGIDFLLSERPDTSINYFLKSYEIDSTNYRSLIYASDAYVKIEKQDSAIALWEKVIEETKQDTANFGWELSTSLQKLSGLYIQEKKFNDLKRTAKQWVQYEPENADAYFFLAISYQATKDLKSACKYYRKTLKYNPKHKHARQYYKKLNCGGGSDNK